MKFRTKIAAIAATIVSCAGMLFAATAPASAAANLVTIQFCNDGGSQVAYDVRFPQRGVGTSRIFPGKCNIGHDISPGEPFITRVYSNDGRYRDTAGYTAWNCNQLITFFGSYDNANLEQKCR